MTRTQIAKSLVLTMLGLAGAGTSYAHEPRVIGGDCNVEVGWQIEPALEDVDNYAVLIIEDCGGLPVAAGDINITVKALRLHRDAFNAPVLNQLTLGTMKTIENFGSIQLTPSVDGAYGFVLNGTIAGRAINNEKFVCGDGSQSAGEEFDCVVNPRVFPGPSTNRYLPN